jgi:hypothetical protein
MVGFARKPCSDTREKPISRPPQRAKTTSMDTKTSISLDGMLAVFFLPPLYGVLSLRALKGYQRPLAEHRKARERMEVAEPAGELAEGRLCKKLETKKRKEEKVTATAEQKGSARGLHGWAPSALRGHCGRVAVGRVEA